MEKVREGKMNQSPFFFIEFHVGTFRAAQEVVSSFS